MANLTRNHLFVDVAFNYNLSRNLLVRVINNDRHHLRFSRDCSKDVTKKEKSFMSQALEAHLKRTRDYEIFCQQQMEEFKRGTQFLAKIMGMNSEKMTQKDIDSAIEYLFPSGLFVKRARPMMKNPTELFKKLKGAQLDSTGRPYHYLFYTAKPAYSQLMHEFAELLEKLNQKCMNLEGGALLPKKKVDIGNSRWILKTAVENRLEEKLLDIEYEKIIESLELMVEHPLGNEALAVIENYFQTSVDGKFEYKLPTTIEKSEGVTTVFVERSKKKKCYGSVKLIHPGVGNITINDKDFIQFFSEFRTRMQVLSPLVLTNMLGKVDVVGTVDQNGHTSQAMVMRSGISFALLPIVSEESQKKLKLAGYLERDPRVRERKKPGRKGARAKYTWLKR